MVIKKNILESQSTSVYAQMKEAGRSGVLYMASGGVLIQKILSKDCIIGQSRLHPNDHKMD